MIRRRRRASYAASTGSEGGDTDTLQTDVMRFMSILGLCLMAVFALVQSIPFQDTLQSRQQAEYTKLQQGIDRQQARAYALQADLDRLGVQIGLAQEDRDRTLKAVTSAQNQLAAVVEQTRQVRTDRERLTVELVRLQQQLDQDQQELTGIRQATLNKSYSLEVLEQQLKEGQDRLDHVSQRARMLQEKQEREERIRQRTREPEAQPVEKKPLPVDGSGKRGFTLRFASSEALDRLVSAGTVSLYGMADKQAWRLSLVRGAPVFKPDTFPNWFHEMAPETVPADYVRTLIGSANDNGTGGFVWGVQLPATTRQNINSLTRGQQGGSLVIHADGRVSLAQE